MFFLAGLVIFYCIQISNAVSLKIDGLIDLGPGWGYEYKIITPKATHRHANRFTHIERFVEGADTSRATTKPTTHNDNLQMIIQNNKITNASNATVPLKEKPLKEKSQKEKPQKEKPLKEKPLKAKPLKEKPLKKNTTEAEEEKLVTKLLEDFKNNNIYSKPKNIKEDAQINFFTTHIFKQTLKVFKALRLKTSDYRIKKQIDFLSRNYERKFKEFVKDTRKHKIKTRLGTQKVILNTIDISNRILTRLVNFLIGDMDKKGILRNNLATANIYQKEVEKETNLEYNHACKKYNICRVGRSFTDFLSEIMSILVRTDDKQLKLAIDSFTEAFKNADFSRSLDRFTEKKLKKAITGLEDLDVGLLRATMMIAKNIINNKNRPLIIHNRASARINQTLALLELFDIFDKHMPNNEANILEWNDITKSFQQWAAGRRNDILEIMDTFVNLFKKSLESMNSKTQQRVENILNMIL